MIVGRNNSGKTSLTEIFHKFFAGEKSSLSFDDISVPILQNFSLAQTKYVEFIQAKSESHHEDAQRLEAEYQALIPSIEFRITFEYDVTESLAPIADLLTNLDPSRTDALLVCSYSAERPWIMFEEFARQADQYENDIIKFLRRNLDSYFKVKMSAEDLEDPTNFKSVDKSSVEKLFTSKFIYAQQLVDDRSTDRTFGLSRGFRGFYQANKSDKEAVQKLEDLLSKLSEDIDAEYLTFFRTVFEDLKAFGVGTVDPFDIRVISQFKTENILADNTRLFYARDGALLPESHNGLGYTRLIFMILEFIGFYEDFKRKVPQPNFQMVFIEEPEAHLHPQMQAVFIKNIQDFVATKLGWKVQIIVTTHSSHIVVESGFNSIRYFDNSQSSLVVKDLSVFRNRLESTEKESLQFLEQYMVLHQCDMFFADKVILIEGTVERLLLPQMISKNTPKLLHQYVSTIEVGGAYALKFRKLLEFLNVQTLIITDIDSVESSGRRAKTKVESFGALTSNETLRTWIPGKSTIAELQSVSGNDLEDARHLVRVAFQVPEAVGDRCGRSFEEAFILANTSLLGMTDSVLATTNAFTNSTGVRFTKEEIASNAYEIAGKIDKKTDFAFDITTLENWSTPKYIKDGLEWLNSIPQ